MNDDVIRIERDGPVAVITLHRPEKRNALNYALAKAGVEAIDACQDANVIVLTGADPAFCAGLDLRNLGIERLADLPKFTRRVADSEVPTIAAVNGAAVTGGFEVALACDFIVASERATFADTHVAVGVFPGPVLLELPRRIGMARAREMSMTGNFVDAREAYRIGLANHLVPHAELMPKALQLARDIARGDRALVQRIRRGWVATTAVPFGEARAVHAGLQTDAGHGSKRASEIAERHDAVLARSREQRKD